MNEDLEITIKVIPAGDDDSHEDNMKAAQEVMEALYRTFKGRYDRDELESRTIIKEGKKEDLPEIFERFNVPDKYRYRNKCTRNKRSRR